MPETVTREELKSIIFSDETRTNFSEYIQSTIMPRFKFSRSKIHSPSNDEIGPEESLRYLKGVPDIRMSTYLDQIDDTWLCATITVPTLLRRHVGIARLKHDTNLGPTREEVKFVILILCPSEVKITDSQKI